MPSNIELEVQLKKSVKEVEELRFRVDALSATVEELRSTSAVQVKEELRQLKDVLDRTLGRSTDYRRLLYQVQEVSARDLAKQLNVAAPKPVSVVATADEIHQMAREVGVEVPSSAADSVKFIAASRAGE
jgi:hypothetical protein